MFSFFHNKEIIDNEKSKFLKDVINSKKHELASSMALCGAFLTPWHVTSYDLDEAYILAFTIKANKSIFSSQEITRNDAFRVDVLALSGLTLRQQKEFLGKNKGMSPLKIAIETWQCELASKFIEAGHILKPNELSIVSRVMSNFSFKSMAEKESKSFVEKAKQSSALKLTASKVR